MSDERASYNPIKDPVSLDPNEDPSIDPASVDPSGDVPAPIPQPGQGEKCLPFQALGVYHVPEDDTWILARTYAEAAMAWRLFHKTPAEPISIAMKAKPGTLVWQDGSTE